jgi:hypothetical protein
MLINEILVEDPQIGDSIDLEFGDMLIETVIEDIAKDGIILRIDETAMRLMIEAKQQLDEITRRGFLKGIGALAATAATGMASARVNMGKPILYMDGPRTGILRMPDGSKLEVTNLYDASTDSGMKVRNVEDTIQAQYGGMRLVPVVISNGKAYIQGDLKFKPNLNEAEYQGRKVSLGKPFLTPDGPKKRSVYVKNPKGNVVKVNFGQKGVKIKKNNPARRKSFRARHNCSTAKDRTTARYWSCRFW